jgi:phosphate-selective porin OprO/OprP
VPGPVLREALLVASLPLLCSGAAAQAADEPALDRVWSLATLYEGGDGSPLQRLALSGRVQLDSAWFDADQGEFDDTLWRRFRFGFEADLRRNWRLHVEGDWDLNEGLSGSYERLTDAYIGWSSEESWSVKLLKHSAGFTLDGATSSKELLTLQRNNLTNNLWFPEEYFTGITVSGALPSPLRWKAGIFSSDGNDELSRFEAAYFTLASLDVDLEGVLGLDGASLRLDHVYNEEHEDANTRDLSQVLSLVAKLEEGDWRLWTDLSAGQGYADQSDLWGLVLMPSYDVSTRTQLVFRYTYLRSAGDNGLSLGRYENEVVAGRGDEYSELYAGVNVYFRGHELKWQTGLQYTDMRDAAGDGGDYEGWGLTTGLRLSF